MRSSFWNFSQKGVHILLIRYWDFESATVLGDFVLFTVCLFLLYVIIFFWNMEGSASERKGPKAVLLLLPVVVTHISELNHPITAGQLSALQAGSRTTDDRAPGTMKQVVQARRAQCPVCSERRTVGRLGRPQNISRSRRSSQLSHESRMRLD
jgi:hypothetical protein